MSFEFGIAGIHHVGIAVADIQRASELHSRILGLKLKTGIIIDELQNVKVAFAEVKDGTSIEFVQPLGPASPVSKIVERGGGIYHVCYVVDDIDRAVKHARAEGGLIISMPLPAKAFAGKRVAFIYMPDQSVVEFLEQ